MNGLPLGAATLVPLLTALSLPACSAEEVRRPVGEFADGRGGEGPAVAPEVRARGQEWAG